MAEMTERQPSPVVYPGALSLLKNVPEYTQYVFDLDEMAASKAILLSGKRKRKDIELAAASVRKLDNLAETFAASEFTIFFFFHPRQPHSLRLRSVLSEFCETHANRIFCLALFGGDPNTATSDEQQEDIKTFLKGTGFSHPEQEAGRSAWSSILKFFDITQIPSIVVVPNSTGRPILGQEIALKWNANDEISGDALLQRWTSGCSGLSLSQSLLAKTLGDSSSVCCLM